MTDSVPSDIIVTELADGVRYQLPRRKAGRFTFQSAVLLLGSLVMGIPFMTFWLFAVGYHVKWQDILRPENGLSLLFTALGLWMLAMIVGLGGRALFHCVGHSEIELRSGFLAGSERLGWLRWSWRRPVAGLCRLDVRDVMMEPGSVRVYDSVAAAVEHSTIVPIWDTDCGREKNPKQLAPGYPRAWLLSVAGDLARRCQQSAEDGARASKPVGPISVSAEPLPNSAGFVDLLEQPARSKIVVVPMPEKLTVTIPARWFGWGGVVFIASREELVIVRSRLFGPERCQWSREQLADIRIGCIKHSEGPDTPELLIQPHPGEGPCFRLALVDEAEARWLATLLRRAVGVPV
jgi:hypothetical protein